MSEDTWRPLALALDRWRDAGRVPRFWLRDDDAVEPTPALERLLGLTVRYEVPPALAVIPAHATEALASEVKGRAHVAALVHGWSHHNHAPANAKKQELGLHRPLEQVLGDLARGLSRIESLFGPQACPVLVPPWNRVDAALAPHLAGLGYRGLSVFGPPKPLPILMINTTVDIIDWHGTRGCRDHRALVGEIVAQLDTAFAGSTSASEVSLPIGILTHHLVHDEAAWEFLRRLFEITTGRGRWMATGALLD